MDVNSFRTSSGNTNMTTGFENNLWSNALFEIDVTSSTVIETCHENQSNVMINHIACQVDEEKDRYDDILGKSWSFESCNVVVDSPEVVGVGGDVMIDLKGKNQKIAFETRSQVDILDDGYKWRKYGQKIVKNNKFARNYYKCNYKGCKVKKQVQRQSKDEGVVVTTYEGLHAHTIPIPPLDINHISKLKQNQ